MAPPATSSTTKTPEQILAERQQEMLDLNAQASAIVAQADSEGRELTPEEDQQFQMVMGQFAKVKTDVDRRATLAATQTALTQPQPRFSTALIPPREGAQSATAALPSFSTITGGTPMLATRPGGPYSSPIDFLCDVKMSAYGKTSDKLRILMAQTTYGSEGVGPDGGFAVPVQYATNITSLVTGEGSLVSRFNPISSQSNQLVLPTDETTPYGTAGIYAEWLDEAATMTPRKTALKQVTVTLKKVGALIHLSDELLRDSPAIQTHVMRKIGSAITAKVNDAIVNGDGVGKPLGLANAPGIVTQSKSGSTLAAVDLMNMCTRMVPESMNNCFWLMHTTALPKIWTLTLGNFPVWTQDLRVSPYGQLLGHPVFVSEYCQDYNTLGDMYLVSPDGYALTVDTGGVQTASTIYFAFDQGLNSFRATMRIGGAPLASAAISRKNGSTTFSHIINLQVRS